MEILFEFKQKKYFNSIFLVEYSLVNWMIHNKH